MKDKIKEIKNEIQEFVGFNDKEYIKNKSHRDLNNLLDKLVEETVLNAKDCMEKKK